MKQDIKQDQPRLSLIIPVFGRPQGTRNLIMDVTNQTIDGWEVILVSDACPHFETVIERADVRTSVASAMARGNRITIHRFRERQGGYGHAGINWGIHHAAGEYLTFAGNDDRLSPYHFENYLRPVTLDPDVDLCFFYSLVTTPSALHVRTPIIRVGRVGHSEMLVRATLARSVTEHHAAYGHDWTFIKEARRLAGKVLVDDSGIPTYVVRRLGRDPEREIW